MPRVHAKRRAGRTWASYGKRAARIRPRAVADATEADLTTDDAAGATARLLTSCARFDVLERRKIQLLKLDGGDHAGTGARLARLAASQARHLREICDAKATGICSHRARALSFALWDAGDLEYRAVHGRATEDLLLHALIRDLIEGHRR